MTRRRSWQSLPLICFTLLVAEVTAKSNNDDRKWGLPSKNTSKNDKKKEGSKPPDDSDDDPSNPFKTSFTFLPQSELTANLDALFNSKDEEKQKALLHRLREFVREKLLDHDEVNKQVNRTRKEWEDLNIEQQTRACEGLMKIGSILLQSSPIKKLMSSREAQESLRQFVLSIKLLLDDPERASVYGNSDRWHAMFDKLKTWEGASQDRLLESLLEFLEKQDSDKD